MDKNISVDTSEFPDPMVPFYEAFYQLLAPKKLLEPDIKNQTLSFSDGVNEFPIESLSSGEKEVVNIVFDFILRSPSDCVVIFDEPELHLHPELSYKLIQTLKSVGKRNQFIFCTHSSDIISSSLDNSVIFVRPPQEDKSNQAMLVSETDETHQALKLIGQSIGIIALGRRIVLIEGQHSSLDKQTYGAILRQNFPNLVLVPSGSKSEIQPFNVLQEKVLNNSIWGIDFFMLCDRDSAITNTSKDVFQKGSRLRMLPRYHLENYFLDENIIAHMFKIFESEDSWLRNSSEINNSLREIARSLIIYTASISTAMKYRMSVGNLDILPKNIHNVDINGAISLFNEKIINEKSRIDCIIAIDDFERDFRQEISRLELLVNEGDDWKSEIPGKIILRKFCSGKYAKIDYGRFKTSFISISREKNFKPFEEAIKIFKDYEEITFSSVE